MLDTDVQPRSRRPFTGPIALNADAVAAAAQKAMHTAGILERERANREMKERVQKATAAAIAAAKQQQLSSVASSSSSCFDLSSSSDSECEAEVAPADPVTGVIVPGKQTLKNTSSKPIA